ncbi:MAG: class I adenylate-forming enzyme family protein [Thermoleophilia bacterium]
MDSAVETLLSLARTQPDRPLLVAPGGTYSYDSFARRAATLAGDLVAGGLVRGASVALLLDNYDDFFVAMFAAWMAGGVAVPLNTTLPASDLAWLIAKSRPQVVLSPQGADHPTMTVTSAADTPRYLTISAGALLEARREALDALAPVAADELAMVMFTSGTTGRPKGVCQRLRAIGANAGLIADALELTGDDRIFINTPPYFTSGIAHFLALMAHGGSTAGRPGFFFGGGLLDEIAAAGCTGFGGAPAHLVRVVEPLSDARPSDLRPADVPLINARPADAPRGDTQAADVPLADAPPRDALSVGGLRFWVSSGDHLPLDVIDRCRRVLPNVRLFNMYGLTEVSGRLCVLPPEELDRRRGSVGRPIGEMVITVRGSDGAATPDGEIGELYVDGPLIMQGYLDDPDVTAAALTPCGFRSGDFGHRDADGFVWVAGRRDDIIKRGGEKVSLVHIQEALRSLGLFADVAVIAADDELLGRVPVAFVVPNDPAGFARAAIMRLLRRTLPATSLPSRIVALAEIPRTGSGKAIRRELLRLDRRPR